ncbi:MAG: hypothetical protein A3E87_01900 [Gammaproteobacteria bacterium RIFCSPHIGHO2_12_FULL_35_23]|nr:MAG: hypothetical protein A3E87_01900 [Gammaproteobacteria bacterium RIFCSPHIGHO2_12_FULL_35_23]
MCRIADQVRKQNPRQEFLPFIFYNGKVRYADSTYLFDLFGEFKGMTREIFTQPFQLIDLNEISDEILRSHRWSGVMELVLKYGRREGVYSEILKSAWIEFAKKLMEEDIERKTVVEILIILVNYSLDQDSKKGSMLYNLAIESAQTNPEVEKIMQTIREKLQAEAKWQGIEQGIQKGVQKGKAESVKTLYRKLQDVNQVAALFGASIEEVKRILADQ